VRASTLAVSGRVDRRDVEPVANDRLPGARLSVFPAVAQPGSRRPGPQQEDAVATVVIVEKGRMCTTPSAVVSRS
jgi:hypothetical protein